MNEVVCPGQPTRHRRLLSQHAFLGLIESHDMQVTTLEWSEDLLLSRTLVKMPWGCSETKPQTGFMLDERKESCTASLARDQTRSCSYWEDFGLTASLGSGNVTKEDALFGWQPHFRWAIPPRFEGQSILCSIGACAQLIQGGPFQPPLIHLMSFSHQVCLLGK